MYQGFSPDLRNSVIRQSTATGDGTTTSFNMGFAVPSPVHVLVFLDGVKQNINAYSVSGSNCVFTVAPANGVGIEFIAIDNIGVAIEPTDRSVNANKMVSGLLMGDYFKIVDEKPPNTPGGSSIAGTLTRDLNTVVEDTAGIVSLDNVNNQFIIPAGKYYFKISVPCYASNRHRAFLYNVSDSAISIYGQPNYADLSYRVQNNSLVDGFIEILTSKVLEVRQFFQTAQATYGLGVEVNDGNNEIYTVVEGWRVG